MAATAGGNKIRNAKLVSDPTSRALEFRRVLILPPVKSGFLVSYNIVEPESLVAVPQSDDGLKTVYARFFRVSWEFLCERVDEFTRSFKD
jgi:hypothetical protein